MFKAYPLRSVIRKAFVVLFCLMFFIVGRAWAGNPNMAAYAPSPGERVGCFISAGDNDFVYNWPAVSSKATIDEFFDILQKVYNVKRIYWRQMNEDQVLDYSLIRPDSTFYDYWKWSKHLNKELGLGEYGIKAARARDMEVWGVAALFDQGSTADMHYPKDSGPSMFEWQKRIEHPEWIPIDKYGLRKMAGAVCFEYPEARKALIDMYVELATRSKYDGILFYLYVEAFHSRFGDEFGFNKPIVDEFRKRYDVDITKEPYDVHALAQMRGEYLTQFFRELREALKPYNIKVGICINPASVQYPQVWGDSATMLVSGRISVDWRKYIREKLIDEITAWCAYKEPYTEPYELINDVLAESQGLPFTVSVFHGGHFGNLTKFFAARGVIRAITACTVDDMEHGYFEKQPATALDGNDFLAKLTVIYQMEMGQTPLDLKKVIAATKDPSVYVRRRALFLLEAINATGPEAIAAAEEALDDPENAVRCFAVETLSKIGTPGSIDKIYNMLDKHGNFMIDAAASSLVTSGQKGLSALPLARTDDIVRGLKHENPDVRAVAAAALGVGVHRPSAEDALISLASDPSAKVRREVARTLRGYDTPKSGAALLSLLDDKEVTVRVMAASSITSLFNNEQIRTKAFEKLRTMFISYNDAYKGTDADWAWRRIGEALEKAGPEAVAALNELLTQEKDPTLADHAWQILYVKLDGEKFLPITPEEAQAGYEKHPRVRKQMKSAVGAIEQGPNSPKMPFGDPWQAGIRAGRAASASLGSADLPGP
jgi:HEAT repeat protein